MNTPMIKGTVWVSVIILTLLTAVHAQTANFTYQGKLSDSNLPANGTYDMLFALFDAPTGGNQINETVPIPNVQVVNGIFTVTLNYGTSAFPGADRYLEISVRQAGNPNPHTLLSPRQMVSSSPYAVQSLNATTAITAVNSTQLGGIAANQYVRTNDIRLTDSRIPLPFSSNYIQNTTLPQVSSNFWISGKGNANIFDAANSFQLGGFRVLSIAGTNNIFGGSGAGSLNTGQGNSFVGFNAGNVNTSGSFNSFFGSNAGAANTSAINNAFFGQGAGFKSTTGGNNTYLGNGAGLNSTTATNNTFVGNLAGQSNVGGSGNTYIGANTNGSATLINATAIGQNSFVGQSNSLILGSINGVNGATSNTNVGLGTISPTSRFHLVNNTDTSFLIESNADRGAGIEFNANGNLGSNWLIYASNNTSIFEQGLHVFSKTRNDVAMTFNVGGTGGSISVNYLTVFQGQVKLVNLGSSGDVPLCLNSQNNSIANCSSSLRYKKEVSPFQTGLSAVRQLSPITFRWRSNDKLDLGFGAENVAKVNPLLVTYNDQGEVEGVKYDRISTVLVNAVNEQQTQIEAQQARIDAQQKQIEQQQEQIDSLKRLICFQNPSAEMCKQ